MKNTAKKLLCFLLCTGMAASFAACAAQRPAPSSIAEAEPASSVAEAEPVSEPEPASEPAAGDSVTVTDQAGREVVIEGPVQKLVSGYYISSSACIALGLTDRLAGIESKAESRPIYALAAPQLLELPNVGSAKEFNLEGCIALEPDLVILPKKLKDSAETLSELGIPVLLVSPENHEDLVEMIALIGQATGTEAAATKLTDYYRQELEAVAALTKDLAEQPSVYLAGNSAYLSTAAKDMYQASLIEAGGGVNAAAQVEGDSWTDVSYEQLLAMNPQIIVLPAEAAYSKEDILGDAQLAGIDAVQNNRVYQMPKGFEAWDSPVPSCTLGIRWMLSTLHGELYPLEALQSDAAAFYKEFYGVDIDTSLIGT